MAVNLREIPVIGAFITAASVLVDVLVQGGDMVVFVAIALLERVDLWLPLLTTLNRLPVEIPGLPEEVTSNLIMIGLALMFAFRAKRLVNYLRKQIQRDEN